MKRWVIACVAIVLAWTAGRTTAGDNELTAQEKAEGWVLLFDGKTGDGWLVSGKPFPESNVQEGTLNPHKAGGGLTYSKERFGNFVLSCDFKVTKGCNSGLFFRTGNPKDEVQTGIEMQVFDSAGKDRPGKHDCGAIYDIVPPSKNAMKPAGEWNHVELLCDRNIIRVVLNGEPIIDMDLDKWTEAGKNPDGTKNKFRTAYKEMPREGHFGFQDHGHAVWYKNIKVKPLK